MANRAAYERERTALQAVILLMAGVPFGLGGPLLARGVEAMNLIFRLDIPAVAVLDSNLRFLAAAFISMGVMDIWIAMGVERRGIPLRISCGGTLLGVLSRLISIVQVGPPSAFVSILIFAEFSRVFLIFWQARIERLARELGDIT